MTPVPTGFKGFLLRGKVGQLAVAVVRGTAFTAVVDRYAESFPTPLVNRVGGSGQLGGAVEVGGQVFTWGVRRPAGHLRHDRAVIYCLVVLPMKALVERRARGEEPARRSRPR
jgi:large conductance mechanosensitive channel